MQFKNTIVRTPGKSMIYGMTTAKEGIPDYERALEQHGNYIESLKKCSVEVTMLEPDEKFPDSCFVEDTALLTEKGAVITRPGAATRQGEETFMQNILKNFYENIEQIAPPATIDGGDIMMAGKHFYIGLSARTNREGAKQMKEILERYGYTASTVVVAEGLHLKSSMAYLENNNLLITRDFFNHPEFASFNKILVNEKESYAANCIWLNGNVLVPLGFPETLSQVQKLGYKTLVLDTSEFRKLDGGLSCLSLRF